jgi:hypothetical protein
MRVRVIGLHEHYEPTPDEAEELSRGFRRRHLTQPDQNRSGRKIVLVADLRVIDEWEMGIDVALSELPEGAKIGDEFELEFKAVKSGR